MAARGVGATEELDRFARLEQQFAARLQRLERLETGAPGPDLSARAAEEPAPPDVGGTLRFSASIRLGDRRFNTQQFVKLSEALDAEPEEVARLFAALGSPYRVRLLRALLEGPRTSHELQAALEVRPVGQLYHHLKELLAAGLIVQRKRSVYAIREEIVMPLLLAFLAAPRFALGQRRAPELVEHAERELKAAPRADVP